MPRKKATQETSVSENKLDPENKPFHQIIRVPKYIDMEEQFGNIGNTDSTELKKNEPDFIVEMAEPKKFDIITKKFLVFHNQELIEEVEDGSEKLEFYLNQNKQIFVPSLWFGPNGPSNFVDIYEDYHKIINVEISNNSLVYAS